MRVKRYLSIIAAVIVVFSLSIVNPPSDALAAAPQWQRLSGSDRYQTAVEISQHGWKQSDTVVIATGNDFPDALCAAPLAKKYNAPILLVGSSLDNTTAGEIKRLGAKTAYLIGGTGVISKNAENQIKTITGSTIRIGGADRFETSAMVAKTLGNVSEAFIVTGYNYPDALSIAPVAAMKGIPILLSEKDSIPYSIKSYLDSSSITKDYVIGGSGVIGDGVYSKLKNPERIYGEDRYGTNVSVLSRFSKILNFNTTFVATGEDFPDALAGSALAPKTSSPLVLTSDTPSDGTLSFLKPLLPYVGMIDVLGGEGVVPASAVTSIIYGGMFYSLPGQGEYEYTGTVTLKNNGSTAIQNVVLEINVGKASTSPYQSDLDLKVSGPGASLTADSSGEKKVTVNLGYLGAGQTARYSIIRDFKNSGIVYNADLSKTKGDYSGFKEFGTYTSPGDKIESDNSLIRQKASEIVQGETNPYLKARKIFQYVNTSLEYDESEGNKGALNALRTGKGVCEDFADLFVAMARASGLPARVVDGFWVQDNDRLNSGSSLDVSQDRHAWAEFYLPEYGWIPAELTFLITDAFGFRVPAFEVFAKFDTPGHIVTDYGLDFSYSLNYEYSSGVKPNVNVTTGEYIIRK